MTLLRHGCKLLHFVHIPKTGGSSLERALRVAGAQRAMHHHRRLGYTASTPQHMHAEVHSIFIPSEFVDYALCVVRHPLARLLSEYKWRISLEQTDDGFDTWVNSSIKRYENNHYLHDNHFRPQVEFVTPDIEVFRFEDGVDRAIRKAAEALGLEGVNDQTHRRAGPEVTARWTASTRERAIEFYRVDFDAFGYDPSDAIKGIELES